MRERRCFCLFLVPPTRTSHLCLLFFFCFASCSSAVLHFRFLSLMPHHPSHNLILCLPLFCVYSSSSSWCLWHLKNSPSTILSCFVVYGVCVCCEIAAHLVGVTCTPLSKRRRSSALVLPPLSLSLSFFLSMCVCVVLCFNRDVVVVKRSVVGDGTQEGWGIHPRPIGREVKKRKKKTTSETSDMLLSRLCSSVPSLFCPVLFFVVVVVERFFWRGGMMSTFHHSRLLKANEKKTLLLSYACTLFSRCSRGSYVRAVAECHRVHVGKGMRVGCA